MHSLVRVLLDRLALDLERRYLRLQGIEIFLRHDLLILGHIDDLLLVCLHEAGVLWLLYLFLLRLRRLVRFTKCSEGQELERTRQH